MATQTSSRQRATTAKQAVEFAVNKTRGLAFSRRDDSGQWESIDPKSMTSLGEMERVSHAKIGDNWFSIYRAGNGHR